MKWEGIINRRGLERVHMDETIREEPATVDTDQQTEQKIEEQNGKKSERNKKTQILRFLKKYGFLLLILIPIFLSTHYRMLPWEIPQAEAWATDQITGYVQEKIIQEVNQQHASLPEETKQELIEQGIQKDLEANKELYEQQKQAMIQQYKYNFQDGQGDTYLGAIDPFQYLRYTENVLDHGYMGEELRDGESYDTMMLAPNGKITGFSLHPYLSAYIYKVVHFFKRDITIVEVLFAMSAIIIGLALIPLFFIVRKFGGNIAALIATSYVALDDNLLNRTIGGFADTDGYGILLPLLVMVFFIESLDTDANTKKKRVIFMFLAAFSMGLFTRTWTGWWVIFGLLIASGVLYLMYLVLLEYKELIKIIKEKERRIKEKMKALLAMFWQKEQIRTAWTMTLGFVIFSFVAILLFRGWTYFKRSLFINLIYVPLNYAQGGISSAVKNTQELWPNVYTTVAELNKISYIRIIEAIGGLLLLILAGVGILFLFLQYKRKLNFFGGMMTTIWLFGMIYTAKTGGVRFLMNISPPLGLALGVFLAGLLKFTFQGIAWLSKKRFLGKPLKKINWPLKILASLIVLFMVLMFFGFSPIPPVPPLCKGGMCKTADNIGKGVMPLIDRQWEQILVKVRQESSPDAIMNSWWDFGHWFKYYAKRRVIFDGASQNIPQAHWMGRALLTADEKEAGAILRMMNCGGNKAYEIMQNTNQNHLTTMKVMRELIMLSPKKPNERAKIEMILKDKGFNETETKKFWERMYCDPPEAYLVTSSDMTGKSAVWGHFGGWSFERALIWRDTRNLSEQEAVAFMKQKLNYSEEKAKQVYNETQQLKDEGDGNSWISGWPSFIASGPCEKQERDLKLEMIPSGDPRREQTMQERAEGKQRKTLMCIIPFGQQQLFLEIDEETKHALLVNTEPVQRPHTIAWLEDASLAEAGGKGQRFGSHRYEESGVGYGIALFKDGDEYFIRFMDGLLPASMYNRLFFYQGIDLKYFDLFARTRSLGTGEIYIWKIRWDRMD